MDNGRNQSVHWIEGATLLIANCNAEWAGLVFIATHQLKLV